MESEFGGCEGGAWVSRRAVPEGSSQNGGRRGGGAYNGVHTLMDSMIPWSRDLVLEYEGKSDLSVPM